MVLSPDGSTPGTIDASGFKTGGRIETGLTDLRFDAADAPVSGEMADGVTSKTFLPAASATSTKTGQAITYWKNRTLADIKSIRAKINYGAAHRENVARTCFFVNDGTTATAQFQSRMSYESTGTSQRRWVMCVKVEFKQVGDDVTARYVTSGYGYLCAEKAKMASSSGLPLDPEFLTWNPYPVKNLVAYRKPMLDLRGPVDVSGGLKLTGGGTLQISSPASGGTKISGAGSVCYASEPRASRARIRR